MSNFVLEDSGNRQQFDTGAVRDVSTNKPRFDLIPINAITRLAYLYARGAIKYESWNWSRGMPFSRFIASMMRHLHKFILQDNKEDNLAAIVFNGFSIMHFQEIGADELDDLYHYKGQSLFDFIKQETHKNIKAVEDLDDTAHREIILGNDNVIPQPRFDLIPNLAMLRVAEYCGQNFIDFNSEIKYSNLICNVMDSIYKFILNPKSKDYDHLAASMFLTMMIMHMEDCHKNKNDLHQNIGSRFAGKMNNNKIEEKHMSWSKS